jgi:hypothetical protein
MLNRSASGYRSSARFTLRSSHGGEFVVLSFHLRTNYCEVSTTFSATDLRTLVLLIFFAATALLYYYYYY